MFIHIKAPGLPQKSQSKGLEVLVVKMAVIFDMFRQCYKYKLFTPPPRLCLKTAD
jgi:hypothetical protein